MLQKLPEGDWLPYLREHSCLPGPRSNLELLEAVALEGDRAFFERCLATDRPGIKDTPEEYVVFCGVRGLGALLADGDLAMLERLKLFANDSRWHIREAAAMALQQWGSVDTGALVAEMERWSQGSCFEQRAAAAALCEPALLGEPEVVTQVLRTLDQITQVFSRCQDRRSEGYQALKKTLGYAWSVAAVALPEVGLPMMEGWMAAPEAEIQWVMRENLKKNRLKKLDPGWVEKMLK